VSADEVLVVVRLLQQLLLLLLLSSIYTLPVAIHQVAAFCICRFL
jgi:hypothetical protein